MKNNKVILIILFLLAFTVSGSAQDKHRNGKHNHSPEKLEEMQKERASTISVAMRLTDVEKEVFVPILNKYMQNRFELYKAYRAETRDTKKKENKTEADYNKLIQAQFDLKDNLADLEKEYYKLMGKILPAQKVYKFRKAEHRFMHKMMDQRDKE